MKFYEDPENVPEGEIVPDTDSDTESCTTDDNSSEDNNSMSSDKVDENMEEDSRDGIVLYLRPLRKDKEDEEDQKDKKDAGEGTSGITWSAFNNIRRGRLSSLLQVSNPEPQQEANSDIDIPTLSDFIRGTRRSNFVATPSLYQRQLDAQAADLYIGGNRSTGFTSASSIYQRQLDAAERGEFVQSAMNEAHVDIPWDD